jgi:hypothetical protein
VIASTAAAQDPLSLQIRDGQVTIKAQNIPLRTILAEWARIGGTNVIGADRVAGAPVTVELTAVPEQEALEVLLRNVSGYMLAFRPAGSQGASLYNRILIMPPSVAPRVLPQQTTGAPQRLPQANVPGTDDAPPDIVLEGPATNRPGPALRQPTVTGPNGQVPAPLPIPETSAPVSPATTPGVIVTPGNPFGVPPGSSSQPGVVTPVPQQQPPGQRQEPN